MTRLPQVTFANLYGPTEATIASSYYRVPACPTSDREAVPIGTGCEGEELLVLDERLDPVPRGGVGDPYIRGVGLSPGYWGDPQKTPAPVVPDPPDPRDRPAPTGGLGPRGRAGPGRLGS